MGTTDGNTFVEVVYFFGRQNDPFVSGMSGLSALSFSGRGFGRRSLDGGRIGGRRFGGIGGIGLELSLQMSDPFLEDSILLDQSENEGLDLRVQVRPKFIREWCRFAHTLLLFSTESVGKTRERIPFDYRTFYCLPDKLDSSEDVETGSDCGPLATV